LCLILRSMLLVSAVLDLIVKFLCASGSENGNLMQGKANSSNC